MKRILTVICAFLLIGTIFCATIVNAQQYEKLEPILFEDRILANQPTIIEDGHMQKEYRNGVSQEILSKSMEKVIAADSSVKIDYSKTIVAKTQEEDFILKYYIIGNKLTNDSYIYFVLDQSKKIKSSGAVFALISDESLHGYVYDNSKLTMVVTGDTNRNMYEGIIYKEDGTIKDTVNYNANKNMRNLVGCLKSCVTEILGGWQTTIILAACVAACGVTVGIGCGVCISVLASYGVGFCWERCA